MSSSIPSILLNISQHITIYVGSAILLVGVIGCLLNIIVFFTLRTFRENPSGFYMTVMSFINIGGLVDGLVSRILTSGFGIDWTVISPFYCKFRWYSIQFFVLTSFTCTSLIAIDQYLATSPRLQWQQWSNIRVAHRLMVIFILIWLLHGIPYFVFFDLIASPAISQVTCNSVNPIYQKYHIYGYLITLAGTVPLIVTSIFGFLAYINIRNLAHRAVPLVQRRLDKQITAMVLYQFVCNFIFTCPYTILTILITVLPVNIDPILSAGLNFAYVLAILLYYLSFAYPFYIYVATSDRFRRQAIHVFFHVYLKRRRQPTVAINQIVPNE